MAQVSNKRVEETPAEIMARQRVGYRDLEVPQDVQPFGEQREAVFAFINAHRERIGNPPLVNDEVENPELAEERQRANEHYWGKRAQVQQERRVSRGLRVA